MMEPSDPRWNAFVAREPFFAVITHPKYLSHNLTEDARIEFFDSGARLVDSMFHTISSHVLPDPAPTSILEFGCGVGRLAIPFAARAASVTAVDASRAMLEIACDEAARAGMENISFKLDSEWRQASRRYDLVNCYLVFQRLRPAAGLHLFRELLGCIGAGGVGVFQFPYRDGADRIVGWTRRIRESSSAVNRLFNIARGKRANLPFVASHVYDLNQVLAIAEESGFHSSHVTFEQYGELGGAILYLTRPLLAGDTAANSEDVPDVRSKGRPARSGAPRPADLIDPRQMIAETSIETLNETAEKYFGSLTEWEHHLAKPFSKADEAPPLLLNLAVLLQGLELIPGMTVLEFGSGTGWLSRYLTQLGCRVILLDVSPTALRIARELYERQPPIGDRPTPRFLEFDGRHIDLEDGSVDRVLCFDSFHHSTDPDATLREFARILRPAGIAAFAEPGPHHSQTPQSQFEMRTYGVIENDVDVHAIWRTAATCGFAAMKLAAFHVPLSM
jgi:ubiquinone/menaquinone biosynthesis C-methylase UbiE